MFILIEIGLRRKGKQMSQVRESHTQKAINNHGKSF